jgi:hypothetical protein
VSASPCCRDPDPIILQVTIPVQMPSRLIQIFTKLGHRFRTIHEEQVVVMHPSVSTQAIEHCDENKAVTTEDLG